MNNIEFSIDPAFWRVAANPTRAAKHRPAWWAELERNLDAPGFPSHTIRACVPVSDAINAGYILPLPFDLHVKSTADGTVEFNWRFAPDEYVSQHGFEQVPIYGGAWKLSNPWVIKTPPGVSVLIIHPIHRPGLPFQTLEGVVDTDTYHNQVNFPFLWPAKDYDDVLRAGTPFAQVIPFRREAWTLSVHAMDEARVVDTKRHNANVRSNQHGYRRLYHSPKKYLENTDAP